MTSIKVPTLPESVSDAVIAQWHKQPGDKVVRDENLVDIETDKVVLEVVAPADGYLDKILFQAGATVLAEQEIGILSTEIIANAIPPQSNNVLPQPAELPQEHHSELTSPAARRLLQEHDLSAHNITGNGKHGQIGKADVEQHLQAKQGCCQAASNNEKNEKRVPMTRLRAKIAERLLQAQQQAAILTTFNEINMQPVTSLRQEHKDAFEKKHKVRLGFMSFFVYAVVEALKRFPAINASIDGQDIVYHEYFDIGIAVSSPRGLVVPVLRNADKLSMAEIEQQIRVFGSRAAEGQLTLEEMTGGTFTISNGGVFGSLMSTPILNPPQSGILGMHKIQERPIVENGQIVIRPMMYVALSYDHRLIDGAESVQFLTTVKDILEQPARLMLQV